LRGSAALGLTITAGCTCDAGAGELAEARQRQLAEQWQQRLERAHYEAELAQRRYRRVDPDHRLVAVELERDWEDKL
jgi:hypothetical protein